jgi:hypothetical protein
MEDHMDVTLGCRFKGCPATVAIEAINPKGAEFSYNRPADWAIQRMGSPIEKGWGVCPEHASVTLTFADGKALRVLVRHDERDNFAVFSGFDESGLKVVEAQAASNTGTLEGWRGSPCSERGMLLVAEAYGLRAGG